MKKNKEERPLLIKQDTTEDQIKKDEPKVESENKKIYNYFTLIPLLITSIISLCAFIYCLSFTLAGYYTFNASFYSVATYSLYFFAVVLFFIAWVVPNHYTNKIRKQTGNYDIKLNIKQQNKNNAIRFPLVTSGLIVIITGLIFELISIFIK